jgi:hypothetical protein
LEEKLQAAAADHILTACSLGLLRSLYRLSELLVTVMITVTIMRVIHQDVPHVRKWLQIADLDIIAYISLVVRMFPSVSRLSSSTEPKPAFSTSEFPTSTMAVREK